MKFLALGLGMLFLAPVKAQQTYFQQGVTFDISAELNDSDNTITSFETIVYKNNSLSVLDYIWFHMWPNAYQSDSSALFQQLKKDNSRSGKNAKSGLGYIDGLSFKINNEAARTDPHPNPAYKDIIKLLLNKPLQPGDSVTITTPFKTKLPPYFSRSGYAEGEFMACQWYPKPAVFDKNGWHEFPYLDIGEFYSEYADYNVKLTLPSAYIVGATGVLLTPSEIYAYKIAGAKNTVDRNGKPELYIPPNGNEKKTLTWSARQVPDFAWFADKNFVIQYDTVMLPSGKYADAFSYYHNKKNTQWKNSIDYIKDAVHAYSGWVGEYAWPVVQVVEGPKNNFSGGMEYPMITLITSPDAKAETLDAVITHEVGHNWFMGMLGTNERQHAWMDEGLNTYYQFRYEAEKYRSNSVMGSSIPAQVKNTDAETFQSMVYEQMIKGIPFTTEMDVAADEKTKGDDYSLAVYIKPAVWMYMLETAFGRGKFDEAMHNYFTKWKFKHPQPEDFQAALEEVTGPLEDFFILTKKKGKLKY